MVWGAIINAGVGIFGGIMQGNQQRSAADSANKESKEKVKAQFERDIKEWDINYLQDISGYAWEIAATEAMRYQERVKQTDYESQQGRVIDAAMLNLELNKEALYDTYTTSEELRALQDNLIFDNEVGKQKLTLGADLIDFGQQGQVALDERNQLLAGYSQQGSAALTTRDQLLAKYSQQGSAALTLRGQQIGQANINLAQSNIDILQALNRKQGVKLDIANKKADRQRAVKRAKEQFDLLSGQEQEKLLLGKGNARQTKDLALAGLTLDNDLQLGEIDIDYATNRKGLQLRAAQSNAESMEAARGYMNSIKQRAAEADQIVRGKEAEGQEIQEDLIISERLDTIRRDAEYITAITEGASTKVQTVTRGGGSNSAQRAALDSMMAYGRSYGEMKALQDQRRTQLNTYNADLVGQTASRLGLIATAISGEADRIKYTSNANLLKNEGFQLENSGLRTNRQLDKLGVRSQTRQGKMEVRNQYQQTIANLTQTSEQNIAKLGFNKQADIEEAREQADQAVAGLQLQRKAAHLQVQDARQGKASAKLGKQSAKEGYETTMEELSLNKQDARQNYKTTMEGLSLDRKGTKQNYKTNAQGLRNKIRTSKQTYRLNTNYLLNNFNQLTVPSYELARRQGEREFTQLVQSTYNEVEAAATPYREAVIFDPLEPMAGLRPEKGLFTPVKGPSWGQIAVNAFTNGAQGAMSQSYTDSNGNLAFR